MVFLFDILPYDLVLKIIQEDLSHNILLFWSLNDNMKNVITKNIKFLLKCIFEETFKNNSLFTDEVYTNKCMRTLELILIEKRDIVLFENFMLLLISLFGTSLQRYNVLQDGQKWVHFARLHGLSKDVFDIMMPMMDEKRSYTNFYDTNSQFWNDGLKNDDILLIRHMKPFLDENVRNTIIYKYFYLGSIWRCRSYEMLKLFMVDWEIPLDVDFAPLRDNIQQYKESKERALRLIDIYERLFDESGEEYKIQNKWNTPAEMRKEINKRANIMYRNMYRNMYPQT